MSKIKLSNREPVSSTGLSGCEQRLGGPLGDGRPDEYLSLEEKIVIHIQNAEREARDQHGTILTDWIIGHNSTYLFSDMGDIPIVLDANLPIGAILVMHRTTIAAKDGLRINSIEIQYAQNPSNPYQDGQPWHIVKVGDISISASRLKIHTPYGHARFTYLDTQAELD